MEMMAYRTEKLRTKSIAERPNAALPGLRFRFDEPVNNILQEQENYRLDMCLTPRPGNARARYPARRGARSAANCRAVRPSS